MKAVTEQEELEVIDLFLHSNMSLTSIAQKYGRTSRDFVYRILNKHNINKKRRHISNKIPIDEIQNVIYLYTKCKMSVREISIKYNYPDSAIRKILKENHIDIRRHYKQSFNENYFDNINTHNKAYLLGFLYADGCINKNNVVSFTVHKQDKEILQMYADEMNATNPIVNVKNKEHVSISFCSKHMCDTLINLGCGHNKTFKLAFPNIDKQYQYNFIRGFMDGDGCISITNKNNHKYISLSFTGTIDMMKKLKSIFIVDNDIKFYRNSYNIHIGKTADVLRILELIYKNADLYLKRKHDKYIKFIEWYNDRS